MGNYSKYISPQRRPIATPESLVTDGKCVFGTFESEFQQLNLLDIDRPTMLPNFLNKFRLSQWEAVEICCDKGIFLSAVCDMALFGMTVHLFYDKAENKLYSFRTMHRSADTKIAGNLLNGSQSSAETSNSSICFVNDFQDGLCKVKGKHTSKTGVIDYRVSLKRISQPSIVSIPFADTDRQHRPLYTQKDLFDAEGTIWVNGKEVKLNNALAVVDDHKGYYPRRSHYDWLTSMGFFGRNKNPVAINLTRNQSIDHEKYNENLIWLKNKTSLLPPVTFEKNIRTKEFKNSAVWSVTDAHGMADIKFHIKAVYDVVFRLPPIMKIEYFVVFGELEGFVLGEDGTKYSLDGFPAIGEDKMLLF